MQSANFFLQVDFVEDASKACAKQNMALAVLETPEENVCLQRALLEKCMIVSYLNSESKNKIFLQDLTTVGYYIGVKKQGAQFTHWLDGQTIDHFDWDVGQPYKNQHCIVL